MLQKKIEAALHSLNPHVLDVSNESHLHSRGQETHYKAVIVTPLFSELNKVKRQQAVYAALKDCMPYALALHCYTPDEWAQTQQAPVSPQCMGGSLHDLKTAD